MIRAVKSLSTVESVRFFRCLLCNLLIGTTVAIIPFLSASLSVHLKDALFAARFLKGFPLIRESAQFVSGFVHPSPAFSSVSQSVVMGPRLYEQVSCTVLFGILI